MIFIIGGRGLVGSAFARVCEAAGRPFAVLDRETYRNYIGKSCEILINANGNSSKPLANERPLEDFDRSVRTVRASLLDFQFERYLHLSSCDVYPDCSSPELTEEHLPVDPAALSAYGFHKHLAEQCVRHGAREWLILRLGGFVGPGLKKNAIFDILHGGPLWLDPASELQFLHTDDAARMALSLIDRGIGRDTVNLCGNGVISLQEVLEATGKTVSVQPGRRRVRYDVSIRKISHWLDVPRTRDTVLRFVQEQQ